MEENHWKTVSNAGYIHARPTQHVAQTKDTLVSRCWFNRNLSTYFCVWVCKSYKTSFTCNRSIEHNHWRPMFPSVGSFSECTEQRRPSTEKDPTAPTCALWPIATIHSHRKTHIQTYIKNKNRFWSWPIIATLQKKKTKIQKWVRVRSPETIFLACGLIVTNRQYSSVCRSSMHPPWSIVVVTARTPTFVTWYLKGIINCVERNISIDQQKRKYKLILVMVLKQKITTANYMHVNTKHPTWSYLVCSCLLEGAQRAEPPSYKQSARTTRWDSIQTTRDILLPTPTNLGRLTHGCWPPSVPGVAGTTPQRGSVFRQDGFVAIEATKKCEHAKQWNVWEQRNETMK